MFQLTVSVALHWRSDVVVAECRRRKISESTLIIANTTQSIEHIVQTLTFARSKRYRLRFDSCDTILTTE
jgi:hypothetical protein